jgi:hypothetical protein
MLRQFPRVQLQSILNLWGYIFGQATPIEEAESPNPRSQVSYLCRVLHCRHKVISKNNNLITIVNINKYASFQVPAPQTYCLEPPPNRQNRAFAA